MVEPKFKIEQIVFLKTDPDQSERMVTGYTVRKRSITYLLALGIEETCHFDFEISEEKNILKSLD